MIRLIVFLVIVAALGFAFGWVADRPGEVSLLWQGMRYETSLMVAVSALVALVAAIMIVWWAISTVLRSPALMRRFFRNRRRDRGYYAVSQGLIAAGSGDSQRARKLAQDSRKLLGGEPLVQLLDAQTLLLEGNHEKARNRFETMLEDDDTRLVALRGLYLEAEREGALEAARHYAEEASKAAPAISWAGNAMLKHQSAEGDWTGALATLEQMRSAGTVDKAEAARKRAVLLTAEAMAELAAEPGKAAKLAREAHRLADDLVPAATTAATALARGDDFRRAAKILESTWKKAPHPDIADAYVHLRSGDSVRDRLKRARKLQSLQPDDPESGLALAEAAIAAAEWKVAREAVAPVLATRPTQRACLIMADIEEGEFGDRGRMRDWLARAVRAPRDPAWMADGMTSERWLPISPISGRIDAFEWKAPTGLLEAPPTGFEVSDDIPRDAEEADDFQTPDGMTASVTTPTETTMTLDAEDIVEEVTEPGSPEPVRPAETVKVDANSAPVAEDAETDTATESKPEEAETAETKAEEDTPGDEKPDNIFPLDRRPDDPGVDPETTDKDDKSFRLF